MTTLHTAAQQAFNLLDRLPINEGYNDETVEVLDALRAGLAAPSPAEAHGDEREAFETWAEACDLPLDESLSGIPGSGPLYVNAETVMAWEGWNARAALNVQPKGTSAAFEQALRDPAISGEAAKVLVLEAADVLAALRADMERTGRNRDMWREQCQVQAAQLETLRQNPAPAPAPEVASAPRAFDAVKSFADSVLAMLDERIKAAEQNAHPFKDYFGDHPETIVAAKAQASELREVRTQVRILGDRALVDLMKFRPATSAPAVGAEPVAWRWEHYAPSGEVFKSGISEICVQPTRHAYIHEGSGEWVGTRVTLLYETPKDELAEIATWRSLCEFLLQADEPMAFLRAWDEGNFDACKREWPEAPASVYPASISHVPVQSQGGANG